MSSAGFHQAVSELLCCALCHAWHGTCQQWPRAAAHGGFMSRLLCSLWRLRGGPLPGAVPAINASVTRPCCCAGLGGTGHTAPAIHTAGAFLLDVRLAPPPRGLASL